VTSDDINARPAGELEDPFDLSDEELDRIVEELEAEQAHALSVLREALPTEALPPLPRHELTQACVRLRAGLEAKHWPYDLIASAAALGATVPEDDVELWLRAAAALISPREEPGLEAEEEATLYSLEDADWLGAVVGVVRAGVGASAEPIAFVRYIAECPEVESSPQDLDEDLFVETGFELVLPTWEAVAAVDENRRLTPLGAWGLPRALALAWGGELERHESPRV
jgi:hypothetical protein